MNKLFTASVLVASAAFFGHAMAQEADVQAMNQTATSQASRAAVDAQTVAAVRAGRIESGEAGAAATTVAKSQGTLTRAQVQAETLEALRLGLLSGGEYQREASASELAKIVAAGQRANSAVLAQASR